MSAEHILVVEDTNLVRVLISSRLRSEGFDVAGAAKVSEALQAVNTRTPDLIVLDLSLDNEEDQMAGLTDGFAFFGMLRRSYPQADIDVIIYSVDHSPEVHARAKSMGAAAVVDKKAGVASLLEAVRITLDERKKKHVPSPVQNCLA